MKSETCLTLLKFAIAFFLENAKFCRNIHKIINEHPKKIFSLLMYVHGRANKKVPLHLNNPTFSVPPRTNSRNHQKQNVRNDLNK